MKLNYKKTFFLGLAFLSISSFWQLYDNIIPLMLKNTFGIGETATGAIMALDNVLALFLLPVFGALSDRTHTKLGKRTPFILFGTFSSVLLMLIIPLANRWGNFPLFFVSLGAVLLTMSTYRSPAVALMPDLTPKPLRSKANAVINLMGAVGGMFTLIMIRMLVPPVDHPDYFPLYISIAALMAITVIVLLLSIKENSESQTVHFEEEQEDLSTAEDHHELDADVKKSLRFLLLSIFLWFVSYNAVTTAFSRYAGVVWGIQGGGFANALMVAMGAAIISFIPIGHVASRIGRKKTILFGIALMGTSFFVGSLFTEYTPLINIVFAFTGIGWASINVNSYPMVVEISKSGDIGKYTGLYYTFSMAAQVFTPIFSGFLLENISYRTLFPYSVFFAILAFITMTRVMHGDSKPTLKKDALEHFDVED